MINPANIFMMMAGQTYFGSKLTSGATKFAGRFSKNLLRGMKNSEIYKRSKQLGINPRNLSRQDHFVAKRQAYQKHSQMLRSVDRFKRTTSNAIANYTPIGGRADRAIGKLFNMTGGKSQAFSKSIGGYIANDLATAPLTYAMYRYDKTQYPEMQNQSFLSYYAETIPTSIGFMAATAGAKGFGRVVNNRVKHSLQQSKFAKGAYQMGLHAGDFISKKLDSHLAYARDMKDATTSAISGAISNRSLLGFGKKIAQGHKNSVRDTRKSIFGTDEEIVNATLQEAKLDTNKLNRFKQDLNDKAQKDKNLFGFMSEYISPDQPMQMTSRGLYKHGEEVLSRGIYNYSGKQYDLRAFSLGKLQDAAANFMDKTGFETGGVAGHLKPFKILQSGFGFLRSEYTKSIQSVHFGGKNKKINDQSIKTIAMEEFEGIDIENYRLDKNNSNKYGAHVRTKATNIMNKILGEKEGSEVGKNFIQGLHSNTDNKKNFYTNLIKGMQNDGSLELPSNTVFYVGGDGFGNILNLSKNGNGVSLKGIGKIAHTSVESKQAASEYQLRINGGNYTRSKNIEELMESRRTTDPDWKPSFWDEAKLKWELGGGPGTRSIWDMASGYINKFKSNKYINNLFTKEYTDEIKNLPNALDNSRHATFINTLDKQLVYSNHNQYMKITNNGNNWQDFTKAMDGFSHTTGSGEKIGYASMSLRGKKTVNEQMAALNMAETYTKDINNSEIGNYIRTAKAELHKGGDVNTIMYENSATLLDQYEASIFQSFGIHGKGVDSHGVEQQAFHAIFDTAKGLHGDRVAGAHRNIMQAHARMKDINNIKIKNDFSHVEQYNKQAEKTLSDFVVNNKYQPETLDMVGHSPMTYSQTGDTYKFNAHDTDTMFLFKEGGALDPKFKTVHKTIDLGDGNFKDIENTYSTRATGTGGILLFNSMNTFNKSLGLLGLGVEHYRSTSEMGMSLMKKRILPMAGGVAGLYAADNFFDNSPLFANTPLSEGLFQVPMNAYAGLRLGSQGILDSAGVTAGAKYLEDLMPGAINSPLSGLTRGVLPFMAGTAMGYKTAGTGGALKGGLIGGAVSMLLGGGPLGAFDAWDISKSRAETLSEFKGEKEVEVKKGRFWLMCLLEGTPIQTFNNGFINIEESNIGDEIFTHKGKSEKINNIGSRYEKEIIKITPYKTKAFQIKVTKKHPIYVYKNNEFKWEKAKDIKVGDYLAYPLINRKQNELSLSKYINIELPTLSSTENNISYFQRLNKNKTGIFQKNSSDRIKLGNDGMTQGNFELGLVFGHYLGDGSISRTGKDKKPNGIEICFGINEYEKVLLVAKALKDLFDMDSIIENCTDKKMYRIRCFNSILGEIFDNLFQGIKKIIPYELYTIKSAGFYKGLLSGLLDSDGTTRKDEWNCVSLIFNNTSLNIIHLFWYSMVVNELYPSINVKNSKYLTEGNYKQQYSVYFDKYNTKRFGLIVKSLKGDKFKEFCKSKIHSKINKITQDNVIKKDNHLLIKVENTTIEKGNFKVWDIEIPIDHSFAGFNIIYHNSSGSFWGNELDHFGLSTYAKMRSDYQDSPNFKSSVGTELMSYVDPSVYNRMHYYSRPSLEHPGMLSNIPVVGKLLNLGNTKAHSEYDELLRQKNQMKMESRKEAFDTYGNTEINGDFASGVGPSNELQNNFYGNPISGDSAESRLGKTFYNLKEVAGLRGFGTEVLQEAITGNKQAFSDVPETEANNIGSLGRSFWDLNLGDLGPGLTEGIRRILPKKPSEFEMYNPVRNLMPNWVSGSDYFLNLKSGDPYCLSKDTPLLTKDGYVNAEDAKIGDIILSHKGNWLPIKYIVKRQIKKDEKVYRLYISGINGNIKLEFSENHPIFIKRTNECSVGSGSICQPPVRNWKKFCDENILTPKYSGKGRPKEGCKKSWPTLGEFKDTKDLRVGDFVVYKIPEVKNEIKTIKVEYTLRKKEIILKEEVILDEELLWVLGLYIAEGSTAKSRKGKPHRLIFSMHTDEIYILEKIEKILYKKFHKKGKIKTINNSSELVICSSKIAQLFDNICSGNLYKKRIPTFIFNSNKKLAFIFLMGMFLGDGGLQRNSLVYECANENLTKDIRRLSFQLGIPASYNSRESFDKRTNKTFISFICIINTFHLLDKDTSWLEHKNKLSREYRTPALDSFSDGEYIYQKIMKIEEVNIKEVFGFEIDKDDTFCSFDFITHNSKVMNGELRLPGEALETARDIRPETPGEADLLGVSQEESMGYYSGDLNIVVPRYFHGDRIEDHKNKIINELKATGNLVKEQSLVYDTGRNISATVDATYQNEKGEIVPVKFVPYISTEGGFMAGSASGLNAYLSLSGQEKGLLIGIDEKGNTTEAIVRKDTGRYIQEATKDMSIRAQSYEVTMERRREGKATAPGIFYSHLDRLKILGDTAFYSREYKNELKIVKAQIKAGKLGEQEAMQVEEIESKVNDMKFKKEFMDEKFNLSFEGRGLSEETQAKQEMVRDKYNMLERGVGKLWEDVTTMRNPILSKLIGNRSALDAYKNDVLYGEQMPQWNTPIDSYVKPFVNKMAVEDNVLQGGLSGSTAGFLLGGGIGAAAGSVLGAAWSATGGQILSGSNWTPEEVSKSRQIMAAADQAENERYDQLYQQTGYREYRLRQMSTISNVLESGRPVTESGIVGLANKPEKAYLKDILAGATESNIDEIQKLLPKDISSLMNQSLGRQVNYNPRESAGDFVINPDDVSNYNAPIEDIIVRTMQREGINEHKVGLGWHKSKVRMNQMESMGMDIPEMGSREMLPELKTSAKINGFQLKGLLMNVLRKEQPNIILENNDGPITIIIEIT